MTIWNPSLCCGWLPNRNGREQPEPRLPLGSRRMAGASTCRKRHAQWVSYELTWDYSRRLPQSRPTARRQSTLDPHYGKKVMTSQVTRHHYTGGQPTTMNQAGVVYWLLTDHLGSTALTLNSSGSKVGELRYAQHPGAQRSG